MSDITISENINDYVTVLDDVKIYNDDKPTTMLIVGRSKTGKSTLLMHLYGKYYNNAENISILFSANSHIEIYKGFKNLLIRNNFVSVDADTIESAHYINENTDNKYPFLFMFDDIIDLKYVGTINKLILTWRNAGLSSIINTQYAYLISRQNRNNINSIFLGSFIEEEHIVDLIKAYLRPYFYKILGQHVKMSAMVQLFRLLTSDHHFIYVSPFEDSMNVIKLNQK